MLKAKLATSLMLISIILSATCVASQPLSFQNRQELVDFALKHNPKLLALKKAALASKELPAKMGRLNDFKIGIRANGTPSRFSGETFDQERYFINQTWPFFGSLRHKAELGRAMSSIEDLKVIEYQNQLTKEISHIAYQLTLIQEKTMLLNQNIKLIDDMITISKAKYETGKSILAHILKAKVFKGKIEESLINLNAQKQTLILELNSLLGLPQSTDLIVTPKLDQSIRSFNFSASQIESWNSEIIEIQIAELKTKVENTALRVSKDKFLPTFSTQVEYWDNGPMRNQLSGQVAMNIPWINPGNYAITKEAELNVRASKYEQENVQNQSIRRIQNLLVMLNQLNETIQLYEASLLRDSKLALENYKSSFEVGKSSFLDWFEAEQQVLNLEIAHIENKTKYHKHLISLETFFIERRIPQHVE